MVERKAELKALRPGVVSLRVGSPLKQEVVHGGCYGDEGGCHNCFHSCIDCIYDVENFKAANSVKPKEVPNRH